jgi:hypothetical protein
MLILIQLILSIGEGNLLSLVYRMVGLLRWKYGGKRLNG